ncbi:cyclic GMP-binding protein C-like [Amphiura filiformis]|uniref:cyclic GMP-binding protein C-like n=1 Tax=Amphiura filiformis TaxID=82378 RepID=UPI003B215B89
MAICRASKTPAEILARGPKALKAFQKASQEGTKHVYRTRLMLVGQERVGKTSLIKSLTGQSFNESEEITDGVDTRTFVEVPKDGPWRVHKTASTDFAKHVQNQLEDAVSALMVQKLTEIKEDRLDSEEKAGTEFGDDDQTETSGAVLTKRVENILQQSEEPTHEPGNDSGEEPEDDKNIKVASSSARTEKQVVPETIRKKVEQGLEMNQDDSIDHKELPEFQIWDFAGHDVYYTTHQVFLSHRAIYIVVCDLRHDLNQPVNVQIDQNESRFHELTGLGFLDFWMQSIYAYVTTNQQPCDEKKPDQLSPAIFIVGTHRDSADINIDPKERKRLISEKFKSIYDMIADKPYEEHVVSQPYAVENSSDSQVDAELSSLRKHIVSVASQETYMGEKIPLKWLTFEKSVAEAIKEGKHFMELNEVQSMSNEHGIQADALFTMLNFYHDLGTIIYLGGDDNTNSNLQDMVILDPQWLIDIFKRIITVLPYQKRRATLRKEWRILEKEGVLADSLINCMWDDLLPQKKALIAIMEMFDLLCPQIAAKEGEAACAYYVPACLQPCSDMMQPELSRNEKDICTFYIDFKGFLPDGLFNRLLVHAARWSQQESGEKPKLHYRNGNFCLDDVHHFQLRMQTTNPVCVKVTVGKILELSDNSSDAPPDAKACSSVKAFLANALNELTTTWIRRITYEFSIACPCNDTRALSEVSRCYHLLPLKNCLMKAKIRCNETQKLVKTEFCSMWFPREETTKQDCLPDDIPTIAFNDLDLIKDLGKGGFGNVWLAHRQGEQVAVKILDTEKKCDSHPLLKEIVKMRQAIFSPYIVRLVGFIDEPSDRGRVQGIVMDYFKYGSLESFLKYLDCDCWPRRVRMLCDIASGIHHLHRLEPPIVHCDVKLSNMFVDHGFTVKMGDLGLSASGTSITKPKVGTSSHMAPEVLAGTAEDLRPSRDIFGFGISMYEFVTGQSPWPTFVNPDIIQALVISGKRPNVAAVTSDTPPEVVIMMQRCWHQDPESRPTSLDIQQSFSELYISHYETGLKQADQAIREKIDADAEKLGVQQGDHLAADSGISSDSRENLRRGDADKLRVQQGDSSAADSGISSDFQGMTVVETGTQEDVSSSHLKTELKEDSEDTTRNEEDIVDAGPSDAPDNLAEDFETSSLSFKPTDYLDQISKSIGPGGDILELADGIAWLDIPSGALDKKTNITLSTVSSETDHPPLGDKFIIGPIVQLEPDGLQFLRPVTLTVKHVAVDIALRDLEVWTMTTGRNPQWQLFYDAQTGSNQNTHLTKDVVQIRCEHFSPWWFLGRKVQLQILPFITADLQSSRQIGLTVYALKSCDVKTFQPRMKTTKYVPCLAHDPTIKVVYDVHKHQKRIKFISKMSNAKAKLPIIQMCGQLEKLLST